MVRELQVFPAGRRGKWLVLGVWLLAIVLAAGYARGFEDAQENSPDSFLPSGADSVEVLDAVREFPQGRVADAVVVFRRESGLTPADRAAVFRVLQSLSAEPPEGAGDPSLPIPSEDGTTALLTVPIAADGENSVLVDAVEDIRDLLPEDEPGGLTTAVTGGAGVAADSIVVFNGINTKLFLATGLLVFVLLLLIYRSPVFWALPLIAVVGAELCSQAVGRGIAESGFTVNGQSAGIMLVLVFGAGTDYALLLTARYREELRRHADHHDAMAAALPHSMPAIAGSAATNIAALLVLLLAALNGTAGIGLLGAVGIMLAMLSALTLLPALLVVCGRWVFWPFIPREGSAVGEESGIFARLGSLIAPRPRRVWIITAILLAVGALGLLRLDTGLTSAEDFRTGAESIDGQLLVAAAFPGGASNPGSVLVRDPAAVEPVRDALAAEPLVAAVGEPVAGPPGTLFDVTLTRDPLSSEASDAISDLRAIADDAAGGDDIALIGGTTAEDADTRRAAARDNLLIIPLVLLVILVILGVLLRSVVAPLLLVATVVLSFAAALGISVLAFEFIFDFSGVFTALPLYGFVFLVALGVDYNIFLMVRAREESELSGTRDGVLRALAVTGGVITAAGIVLAGTFSVLGTLPLVSLAQIGFVVAFGVLLDTLVVRSILVPALVRDLGPVVWRPAHIEPGGG